MLCAALCAARVHADEALHSLWELHGKHNTVYVLGSIHTLRASDYPLAPAIMDAYRDSKSLVMEIDLNEIESPTCRPKCCRARMLPEGKTLEQVVGPVRYARAQSLVRDVGLDLSMFGGFAPWFVAEAVSQLQLAQLGFDAQSGVEMFFMARARERRQERRGAGDRTRAVGDLRVDAHGHPSRIPDVESGAGSRLAETSERHGPSLAARRHGLVPD